VTDPHALAIFRPAVAICAVAGCGLGVAYFASLRHGVHLALARHACSPYVPWALARMAVAALFFVLAARSGLPALIAGFGGFLLARQVAVRAARRPA
jgi:hypothetical protein